jgi:hypothetical protein
MALAAFVRITAPPPSVIRQRSSLRSGSEIMRSASGASRRLHGISSKRRRQSPVKEIAMREVTTTTVEKALADDLLAFVLEARALIPQFDEERAADLTSQLDLLQHAGEGPRPRRSVIAAMLDALRQFARAAAGRPAARPCST